MFGVQINVVIQQECESKWIMLFDSFNCETIYIANTVRSTIITVNVICIWNLPQLMKLNILDLLSTENICVEKVKYTAYL